MNGLALRFLNLTELRTLIKEYYSVPFAVADRQDSTLSLAAVRH
jgi:hypothetical protein